MPRGRFGLGAPLSVDGPRKRGELYGNRIPVPTRILSGGNFPLSRPGSTSYDQRRSFSASIISNFDDDQLDFSPISSPAISLPPDSPDSVASLSDISPLSADFSKQNIPRATSFSRALEVARKAETEKQKRQNSTNPTSTRMSPHSEGDSDVETLTEMPPSIVVSSEDVSSVMIPETPIVDTTTSVPETPKDSLPLEEVRPNEELSYKPPPEPVIANGASPMAITHKPLEVKEVPRVGTPPLNIRKRVPIDLGVPPVVDKVSKDPGTDVVSMEPQVSVPQAVNLHDVPARISDVPEKETVDSLPIPQPKSVEVDEPVPSENIELVPEILPILSPPDIVVNEQPKENNQEPDDARNDPLINSNAVVRSRKLGLTLDAGKLADGTSSVPSSMLNFLFEYTYTKPLMDVGHAPRQATTIPSSSDSFSTSLATSAITSPGSFLSPPDTGLQSGSASSGSLLSSLGSRPMSMIESSPRVVTQMLRMTPATSRGVPMFLPGNAAPRKSDFVYFPPTPEHEDTDLDSLTSHPQRMRSESDPEDIRNMPSKQTFSAVVHRKVREPPASATVPDEKPRPLPQTPQARRVQRATILETPLSPGHGELAALLQEAVLLEDTLNKGELPSEETRLDEETQQREDRAKEAAAAAEAQAKAKAEDEERSRLALATAQLQIKRDEPTAGRLKHTFLVPLSKARSRHRKEVYTAKAESFLSRSAESPIHPPSAGLQSTDSFAMASDTLPKMPAKQRTINDINSIAQLPTKAPKFSSLRKFSTRTGSGGGALVRTGHSTSSELSSEESSSVTPDEFGRATGSTLSFPSVSPKKASGTLARASSFAERLFSRGRTKSGGSTLSSTSENNGKNSCSSLHPSESYYDT